ncbi:MAG: hypothetical protein V4608_14900 [Bacteroidota bacterium]
MNLQQLKKRLHIILDKIENVEDIQGSLDVINNPDHEYYKAFGNDMERQYDAHRYHSEIKVIQEQINKELEFINELK